MHGFYSWLLLHSIMTGSDNMGTRRTSGTSDLSLVGFGVLVSFGIFVGVAVGCCVETTGGGSAGTMGVTGVSVGISVGMGGTAVGGTAVVGWRIGVSVKVWLGAGVKVCLGAGVMGVGVTVG
jgi:hypothetical protein